MHASGSKILNPITRSTSILNCTSHYHLEKHSWWNGYFSSCYRGRSTVNDQQMSVVRWNDNCKWWTESVPSFMIGKSGRQIFEVHRHVPFMKRSWQHQKDSIKFLMILIAARWSSILQHPPNHSSCKHNGAIRYWTSAIKWRWAESRSWTGRSVNAERGPAHHGSTWLNRRHHVTTLWKLFLTLYLKSILNAIVNCRYPSVEVDEQALWRQSPNGHVLPTRYLTLTWQKPQKGDQIADRCFEESFTATNQWKIRINLSACRTYLCETARCSDPLSLARNWSHHESGHMALFLRWFSCWSTKTPGSSLSRGETGYNGVHPKLLSSPCGLFDAMQVIFAVFFLQDLARV